MQWIFLKLTKYLVNIAFLISAAEVGSTTATTTTRTTRTIRCSSREAWAADIGDNRTTVDTEVKTTASSVAVATTITAAGIRRRPAFRPSPPTTNKINPKQDHLRAELTQFRYQRQLPVSIIISKLASNPYVYGILSFLAAN